MVRQKAKYNSLEEWQSDFKKAHLNPDDVYLMQAIIRRVEASSEGVQRDIKEYLLSENLINNPWITFKQVAKENPNHRLMINNKDDPWFYV